MTETEEAFAVKAGVDRRIKEHLELMAMVKRLSFLLGTARILLVVGGDEQRARSLAIEALSDAKALVSRVEA